MDEEVKPKSKPVLMPQKFGLAEHKRHDWVIEIEPNLSINDICDPAYWAHVAFQMEPLDHIEARWEDGTKIVHLIVKFCERAYAKVFVDRVVEMGETEVETPQSSTKHTVEWKGPILKWCVIRISDKEKLKEGFKSRGLAADWIIEHERS